MSTESPHSAPGADKGPVTEDVYEQQQASSDAPTSDEESGESSVANIERIYR